MFDIFYSGTKPNLFAHEQQVEDIKQAQSLSRTRYFWWVHYLADLRTWDFLWEPKPWESHQRHAWPSQHQKDVGVYLVPRDWDGQETHYHNELHVKHKRGYEFWNVPLNIDLGSVDFTWHPDPSDPPYMYHFPSQWQPTSGVTYTVPGATEIKIIDAFQVQSTPVKKNWQIPLWVNAESIDQSWHPNFIDPPCNYHFETKWQWNRVGGPMYVMDNVTDIKYIDDLDIETESDPLAWYIPDWIDPASIDPTWVPCPADPPYIYEFAVEWGWNNIGGPEYRVAGATERKYVDYFVARTCPDPTNFKINYEIEADSDVLRWRPNPAEPPYIYVFGNQWYPAEIMPTVEYHVPGATEHKYMEEPRAQLSERPDNHWNTLEDCNWDYSWRPDPGDPPYIYVFGNQHWPAEIMPTVEYHVEGATERKYMESPVAGLLPTEEHWVDIAGCAFEFDYSWRPDPGDPAYIYVFGNQWHAAEVMPTVEYHVPGATERKFVEHVQARILADTTNWQVPEEVDSSTVDFSWIPDPGSPPYVYHFGTDYQASVGLTYTVLGATELKFAGDIPKLVAEKKAVAVLDIFYMDRSNAMSQQRFAQLQERYPHIQKIRYVNSVMQTIKRCAERSKTTRFWVIGSENDYTEFDFAWHAAPWQSSMTHVFGSQWNKWSDTFLINKWEFERHARWAKDIEEFPNLNFVEDQTVHAPADATDIYVIDHNNREWNYLVDKYRVVKSARYFDNYLDTFKRLLDGVDAEHIWVVSSLCDYSRFDFSWQPEAWQRDMLHVFPSNEQKFGDTFYVPVKRLREQIDSLELLDWFDTVNYCEDQKVERYPLPVIKHTADTHVNAVIESNFIEPFALFTDRDVNVRKLPTVSLWREKNKTIVPLDAGAAAVIVPKNAIASIKTQLYDYSHIDKTRRNTFAAELQDVIFISYDEPDADKNWALLKERCPRAQRVHGVAGMELALEAAADLSTTPWYYAVFAKTRIYESFDFSFVPDRMQQPKHYIFDCRNSVNGLEYGHMGIVMYNCQGIRDINQQQQFGLDYTLSFPHESVPVLSCYGDFATTPYHAWRTAFREVSKLGYFESVEPTVEGAYRLKTWLNYAQGPMAKWCLNGARDGIEFFEQSQGDLAVLKQGFRWEWLREYFVTKYGDLE